MDIDLYLESDYEDRTVAGYVQEDNWDAELFDDSDIDIPLDWDPDDII